MSSFPAQKNTASFDELVRSVRACRVCRDRPLYGKPLDHEPRPVLQISRTAHICIAGQAPGTRVQATGRPFDDPSGKRLRQWLGIDEAAFYDARKIAILPMSFCFPGLRADGSDLPPRRECADIWRAKLFAQLPNIKLLLAIGAHAQRWHLGPEATRQGVNQTVRRWREIYDASPPMMRTFPLPHPSWHNNRWLNENSWFENDLLAQLRADIRNLLAREVALEYTDTLCKHRCPDQIHFPERHRGVDTATTVDFKVTRPETSKNSAGKPAAKKTKKTKTKNGHQPDEKGDGEKEPKRA